MGYLYTNKKCPCRTCDQRRTGCHGDCEGYKEWRKDYDKNKAENTQPAHELSQSMKRHIWRRMLGR